MGSLIFHPWDALEAEASNPSLPESVRPLLLDLLKFARQEDLRFLGVADLSQTPYRWPRAIALALPTPADSSKEQIGLLGLKNATVTGSASSQVNQSAAIESLTSKVSQIVQAAGFHCEAALADGAPKTVARLAGLGWIGRNSLLITPNLGPRIALAAIFTDALLPATAPLQDSCGACRLCVVACPAKAHTGDPFDPANPQKKNFHPEKCANWTEQLRAMPIPPADCTGDSTRCNLCVTVCPYAGKPQ